MTLRTNGCRRRRSQTWKTFLHNHVAGIGAMDFLIVPTVGFRLLFVLVILRHQRRRLISLTVTAPSHGGVDRLPGHRGLPLG
jgi:hypothetical protein